ncbi:MAG: prepilin-type N-terminal cleavage/methylation domain-containing protein [bacterium]
MKRFNGFTIIELMLTLAITSIIIAASVPFFYSMNHSWKSVQYSIDTTQDSRFALSLMEKELKQADRINQLSDTEISIIKSNGDITGFLTMSQGSTLVLAQMIDGTAEALTGEIDSLLLEGFAADGSLTTVPSKLKALRITLRIGGQTMQTQITFPKDFISTLYYGITAGNYIILDGSGEINGNIHANHTIQEESGNSITINGDETDLNDTAPLPLPDLAMSDLLATYSDLAVYKAKADTIYSSDHTFSESQTYTGIYYIANGANATIEKNVTIEGSIVVEGDLTINGHNIVINAPYGQPALIAGNDIFHNSDIGDDFETTGVVYAGRDIIMTTKDVICHGNDQYNFTYIAGRNIHISSRQLVSDGGIVAGNDLTLNQNQTLTISTSKLTPILACGNDMFLMSEGLSTTLTGLIYSGNNFLSEKDPFLLNGNIIAHHNLQLQGDVSITYSSSDLDHPPIHFMESEE